MIVVLHRRNRRHQAGAGLAAGGCARRSDGHRQHRRRHRVVGTARFARRRFRAVRAGRAAEQGPRLGRGGRQLSLPGAHEATGQPAWFSLGDLDLATHLTRTTLLRAGKTLSAGHGGVGDEARDSRAGAAHVRRSRVDHARHREGHADVSGVLRARAPSGRGACGALRRR